VADGAIEQPGAHDQVGVEGTPAPRTTPGTKDGPSQYTLGRQLRETERAMVKAQKRVDQLTEHLGAATDHADLHSLGSELASAQAELDELESRWLELAELQTG
jgi:hypothetical protein